MYYFRRIFKYPLEPDSRQIIYMPKGAEIIKVGRQGQLPFLWAVVDEEQPVEQRMFRNITTGEDFNEERLMYVGHVQLGAEKPDAEDGEGWYELFCFEYELALPQLSPDIVSDRFVDDRAQIKRELQEAS